MDLFIIPHQVEGIHKLDQPAVKSVDVLAPCTHVAALCQQSLNADIVLFSVKWVGMPV